MVCHWWDKLQIEYLYPGGEQTNKNSTDGRKPRKVCLSFKTVTVDWVDQPGRTSGVNVYATQHSCDVGTDGVMRMYAHESLAAMEAARKAQEAT